MPYKSEKIKIEGTSKDARRKLTEDQKREIKENKLGLSQRKLADMYNVSRRTIQFILDPEKLEKNKKKRKERGGSKVYYDRKKNTDYMRKHRNRKQSMYVNGEIMTDEEILKLDFYDFVGSSSVFMSNDEKIEYYKTVIYPTMNSRVSSE